MAYSGTDSRLIVEPDASALDGSRCGGDRALGDRPFGGDGGDTLEVYCSYAAGLAGVGADHELLP